MKGFVFAGAAFVTAFVVYKGLIFGFGGDGLERWPFRLAACDSPAHLPYQRLRFAGLGVLYALGSVARRNGKAVALAPRHV
jgi:hypothetical protein